MEVASPKMWGALLGAQCKDYFYDSGIPQFPLQDFMIFIIFIKPWQATRRSSGVEVCTLLNSLGTSWTSYGPPVVPLAFRARGLAGGAP
jgi:hypothetical protein